MPQALHSVVASSAPAGVHPFLHMGVSCGVGGRGGRGGSGWFRRASPRVGEERNPRALVQSHHGEGSFEDAAGAGEGREARGARGAGGTHRARARRVGARRAHVLEPAQPREWRASRRKRRARAGGSVSLTLTTLSSLGVCQAAAKGSRRASLDAPDTRKILYRPRGRKPQPVVAQPKQPSRETCLKPGTPRRARHNDARRPARPRARPFGGFGR